MASRRAEATGCLDSDARGRRNKAHFQFRIHPELSDAATEHQVCKLLANL